MNAFKIAAVVLIAIGIVALVYGGFTYTKETTGATLGPIELKVNEKKTVNIPVWAGVGSVVLGAAMLAYPLIKR